MTLIARWYVATWGGPVNTVMVNVKLFPEDDRRHNEIQCHLSVLKGIGMIQKYETTEINLFNPRNKHKHSRIKLVNMIKFFHVARVLLSEDKPNSSF